MKNIKSFLKENIFLVFTVLISASLLVLVKENLLRVISLELLIWSWYIVGKKTKDFTYASFLLILFSLPFNISIQIPIEGIDPYVNGIFTNYLIPVAHILDMGMGILIASAVIERKFKKKDLTIDLGLIFALVILQLFLGGVTSFIGVLRILTYLIGFRIIIKNIKIRGDKKTLTVVKGIVVIQVVIALLQFLRGSSLGVSRLGESNFSAGLKGSNFIDISGNLYIRGYGTFPHPNILGGWLLCMMISLWVENKGLIFLIVSSIGILLTFSRVAIFLMIFFWIFVVIDVVKKKKGIEIFSFFPLLVERVTNLFTSGDMAVADRVNLFKEGLKVFRENGILGVGYGNFVKEMGNNMPRTANGVWLNQPVHNIVLLSLSELGILGTGIVIWGYRKTFFLKKIEWNNLRITYIFLVILIIGMVDHYMFSLPQGLIILSFLSLSLSSRS